MGMRQDKARAERIRHGVEAMEAVTVALGNILDLWEKQNLWMPDMTMHPAALEYFFQETGLGMDGVVLSLAFGAWQAGQTEPQFRAALLGRKVLFEEALDHLDEAKKRFERQEAWPWSAHQGATGEA